MIRGEEIIEDIMMFKGFWKASFKDKAKWLVAWVFFASIIVINLILWLITAPFSTIKWLFNRK